LNTFAVANEQGKTSLSGIVPTEMEDLSVADQACCFFSGAIDSRGVDSLEDRY
jgi:hypothetical protein